MAIIKLSITGLRNLQPVTLALSPRINIFYGDNGSGKTSILEAIHLLGLARSFRSHKINTVINYQANDCIIFGQINSVQATNQLGIYRDKQGQTTIKINGQNIRTTTELANLLPLQIINPDSFKLLEGSPKLRRQFIDWGVFHSEPLFLAAWQKVQKALKQRNSWLRQNNTNSKECYSWNIELSKASEQLDGFRAKYITELTPIFKNILNELVEIEDFTLNYYRGWEKGANLLDILNDSLARDKQVGHTQAGPQRADLRLKIANYNAADVLSRGQQKLVVCALRIAQGYLINHYKNGQLIYLIDDLASELDEQHRTTLCKLLEKLQCQVFITGVEKQPIYKVWQELTEKTEFQVTNGKIYPNSIQ